MKKIVAVGFAAALALLPAAGASAEQIKPLNQTKSTQTADSLAIGGLTPAAVIGTIIAVVAVIAIAGDDDNVTTTTN
jgi:hypothetical protein